jgi:predicted membrane-bound spermidine synthase
LRQRFGLTAFAFLLSGASALVYQVAWQRILGLHTGVGIYSVAMIVSAFMAGLGIGSHLGGEWSLRLSRHRALLAFARLELLIAAFGLLSVTLYYDWLYARGPRLYAAPWRAGLLHFASLLPPTVLMGMSLPFMTRATVDEARTAGRTVGLLYATNMLGASLGALLAPWVLIRHLGLDGAVTVAAAGNALAGLMALALWKLGPREKEPEGVVRSGPGAPETDLRTEPPGQPLRLWVLLYTLSGFCALSLELLWFRVLDVATRSTAFTFGTLLSIYLLGSAAGCFIAAPQAVRLRRPLHTFLLCQCALLAYSGLVITLLVVLPARTPGLAWLLAYWSGGSTFYLGHAWERESLLRLYLLLPLAIFGPPTVLMGFSFPTLQRAVQDDPRTSGRKVGILQAANIAGCMAGSLAVGLLALGSLGTTGSMRLLMVCGLIFAAVGLWKYGPRSAFAPLAVLLVTVTAAVPAQDGFWRRLHGSDNPRALVAEDATGVGAVLPWAGGWHVVVNGKHHSALPFGGIHTRLGVIPAIVHPAPVDVAAIGLGSGDTAWAASCRRETRSITVFETSGPQRALLVRLAGREALGELQGFLGDPRLAVRLADGRHALSLGRERYDLIEADALWPYAAYSGNLYSVEFFRECAGRLKTGGLMCTWVPTDRVAASFRAAFPYVAGPRRRVFLLGSNEPISIDPEVLRTRLHAPEVVSYLGEERVADLLNLLLRVRLLETGEPSRDDELNRDLFPRDEFLAP